MVRTPYHQKFELGSRTPQSVTLSRDKVVVINIGVGEGRSTKREGGGWLMKFYPYTKRGDGKCISHPEGGWGLGILSEGGGGGEGSQKVSATDFPIL